MKVLVFGATGKTGGLIVDRALAKGHEVTVLVRDASKFKRKDVRVLSGGRAAEVDLHARRVAECRQRAKQGERGKNCSEPHDRLLPLTGAVG